MENCGNLAEVRDFASVVFPQGFEIVDLRVENPPERHVLRKELAKVA